MTPAFVRRGRDASAASFDGTRSTGSAPAVPAQDSPEGVVLGARYRLGPLIGRGGMATVYSARDLLLNRDVAIKVFKARAVDRDRLRAVAPQAAEQRGQGPGGSGPLEGERRPAGTQFEHLASTHRTRGAAPPRGG